MSDDKVLVPLTGVTWNTEEIHLLCVWSYKVIADNIVNEWAALLESNFGFIILDMIVYKSVKQSQLKCFYIIEVCILNHHKRKTCYSW